MVGTNVRDSPYEAIRASTTFSASGVKMYFAEPDNKVTGTNTMQIDIVEISAGIATCSALSRIAVASGFFSPVPRLRCVFSISTVASSTSMPTARARPPSDITLIVSPSAEETAMANKTASGMETLTISVLRQLPRNTRIIMAVRNAAVTASCTTSWMEARTSTD